MGAGSIRWLTWCRRCPRHGVTFSDPGRPKPMSTQSTVGQLAEQTMGVVEKVMRSLEGPLDDFGPFLVAVPGDGSQPRLVDLPNELLTGEAAGKAEVVQQLVRPAITETGAKRIAW